MFTTYWSTIMKIFIIAFTLLSLQSTISAQNTLNTIDPKWKQLSQTYGFIFGQQYTLEQISNKFPDLTPKVKEACFAFNGCTLGECVKGLEDAMNQEYGIRWLELKKQMKLQLSDSLVKQDITKENAVLFLNEVKARAKGQLPDSIRSSLLSVHPRYTRNPELEIAEGWTQHFRTKEHPKAKEIDLSIQIPASWNSCEGNRPNVVQSFRSEAGHGPVICVLIIKKMELPAGYILSEEEVKDFFKISELKNLVPRGGRYVSCENIVLENMPAAIIIYDTTRQRVDEKMDVRFTQFITIYKGSIIFIQFTVTKMQNSHATIDELQKRYILAYKSIANTFVLNDKYK